MCTKVLRGALILCIQNVTFCDWLLLSHISSACVCFVLLFTYVIMRFGAKYHNFARDLLILLKQTHTTHALNAHSNRHTVRIVYAYFVN